MKICANKKEDGAKTNSEGLKSGNWLPHERSRQQQQQQQAKDERLQI
jgi:hypothetical protein